MRGSGSEKVILPNTQFAKLASEDQIRRTMRALETNNVTSYLTENSSEARKKVLELLPPGAEVFTSTSRTLESIGVVDDVNYSGHYVSLRSKIAKLDRKAQANQIRLMASTPD